jgi:HAE1 family hydrophobic/amphiphilic exporter-1
MSNIVETSIKKPLIIGVIFTILALSGLLCYNMLNLNLLPKMDTSITTIATVYPGAGAAEVETSVTKKIEDVVSSLENLDKVNSTSREGVSIVTVQFNESADIKEPN